MEENLADLRTPDGGTPDTVSSQLRPVPGVDVREEEQLERVAEWSKYAELFQLARDDRLVNTWHRGGDHIHNGYYATPDAEAYMAMIGDERPDTIVEVGGGYSTLLARHAIDQLGISCRLIVIDPEPWTDVGAAADSVVTDRVENVDVSGLFGSGTGVLFVDSSHVVRAGGDVPYLYGQVIPRLPAGTFVHVHDVYLPYDYPAYVARYLWTEQYMLEVLLSHSPRYRCELTTHLLSHRHAALLRRVVSPVVGTDPHHYGAAVWFKVCPGEPG